MTVLADTHALIWWLTEPSRLSSAAHKQLRAAYHDTAGGILISVASRIDLHYLAAKGKLAPEVVRSIWDVVDAPDTNLRPVPVTATVAERFGDPAIAGALPDPWDRLLVATLSPLPTHRYAGWLVPKSLAPLTPQSTRAGNLLYQ